MSCSCVAAMLCHRPVETYVVGDVHGDRDALLALLRALGWKPDLSGGWAVEGEPNRLVFVGDIVDRGPDSLGCLQIVRALVSQGDATVVRGNHEVRLQALVECRRRGALPDALPPSRVMTWTQLLALDMPALESLHSFLRELPNYVRLPGYDAVVVHARWAPSFAHLPSSEQIRACAFGRVSTPDSDPLAWASKHRGVRVVWGHRIVTPGEVTTIGRTVNVESGCCEGHALSAFALGSGRVVQVPSSGPWRRWMSPLERCETVVFPRELETVARRVVEEGLEDADDYIAWLGLELDAVGAVMNAAVERTHRALFARVHPARKPS